MNSIMYEGLYAKNVIFITTGIGIASLIQFLSLIINHMKNKNLVQGSEEDY